MSHIDREEQEIWESWLPQPLGEYVTRIRSSIINMHSGNEIPIKYMTPHGASHCQAVEDLIHQLIPKQKFRGLREKERFFLLASAWLHDIGMLRSVARRTMEIDNPLEIRKKHHNITQAFIINNYAECGVDEEDARFLGMLCFYHRKREDIGECRITDSIGNQEYKLRLLAAYLRLADALHIDSTRTPHVDYVTCLAYDIPPEEKLHWVKSRLVPGIRIDHENHVITVIFRTPTIEQLVKRKADPNEVNEKINKIIKNVMDDLHDELESVKQILTEAGISYFSDIVAEQSKEPVDEQILDDLLTLVLNYDIKGNPSASKLLEMTLVSIGNIVGYHLKKDHRPSKLIKHESRDVRNNVIEFINSMQENIRFKRQCHLGLMAATSRCKLYAEKLLPGQMQDFIQQINLEFQKHVANKMEIRKHASLFIKNFSDEYLKDVENELILAKGSGKSVYNILLYGYSELVMKALCGFRDYLISFHVSLGGSVESHYKSKLETDQSEKFRLFICEGQPKTHTVARDRLLYHDGFTYAQALAKRNFNNVILIPDIIAGSVIENENINLIIVGANGITDNCFKHSAGHGAILKLVREYRSRQKKAFLPTTILVVSKDKYCGQSTTPTFINVHESKETEVEGYRFWKGTKQMPIRENIWFSRDLEMKRSAFDVLYYNPREDIVPIDYLDYVITESGYYKIWSDKRIQMKDNIRNFIKAMNC